MLHRVILVSRVVTELASRRNYEVQNQFVKKTIAIAIIFEIGFAGHVLISKFTLKLFVEKLEVG